LVVVSVLGACGDPGSTEAQRPENVEVAGDPFVELFDNPDGTSVTMRAGLGDDLALIRADYDGRGGQRPSVAAYRTPDGKWGELPVPPVEGVYELAGVRDTVMIGGFECRSDDCSRRVPRFLVLDDDRRSWREVPSDLAEIRIDPDGEETEAGVGMVVSPQVMNVAVFRLGFTDYVVDPDAGPVELTYDSDPLMTNPNFVPCWTDDVEILVPFNGADPPLEVDFDKPWRLDGVVLARDLNDVAAGFEQIATAPRVDIDRGGNVCGYRSLFLYRGETEYQFDLDTLEWTSRTSNYKEVNSGITVSAGALSQKSLPDGTVWDAERERAPDGTWSTVPPGTGQLVVTGSGVVYGIGEDVTTYRDAR
jgi:hypothetical protein